MSRKDIINTDGSLNYDTLGGFKDRLDGHDASLAEMTTNILSFGGNPDGVTDNLTPFNNAKTAAKNKEILFPQNSAGNAVYYFSSLPDFSGYRLKAGKGVVFSLPTNNNTSFKNSVFDGNITFTIRDRNNSIVMPPIADEHLFLADIHDLSCQSTFANETSVSLSKMPTNSHVYTAITPTDETYDYLVTEILSDLTSTFFSQLHTAPQTGKEYFGYIDGYYDHPTAHTGFMVEDANRIHYFYFDAARNFIHGANLKSTDTYQENPSTTLPDGIQTQSKSSILLSVQMVSTTKIKLFVNGVFLTQFTCADPISKLGFCFNGYAVSNAIAYGKQGVRIGKMTSSNIVPKNGRELNIAVFGDSISFGEGTDFSWSEYALPRMLKGKYGISRVNINNQAISGCTLHDQRYYFLTMPNLNTYNYVLVLLGTNDIAVQTDITSFRNDIGVFISNCQSAGVPIIFGIPPMAIDASYSGYGYQMNNIHLGAPYRYAFYYAAANNTGTYIADVISEIGNITAQNEVLRDNVHPTHKGAMLIAKSFAKTILNIEKDNIASKITT